MGVVHALQYLFCIHFYRFNLPTASYVSLSNFICRKYICIYCIPSFSSSPLKHLVIRLSFMLLRFFVRSYSVVLSGCFFVLTNFILTKHSRSHLSRIALYSFASLDLVVSSSYLSFFFSSTISSYYPTLLSRSVCTQALYITVLAASRVFFQFV